MFDQPVIDALRCRRLLTVGPDSEPMWVRLYIQPVVGHWAAMICGDNTTPPATGGTQGLSFFAETAEEAERLARAYLGLSEPSN